MLTEINTIFYIVLESDLSSLGKHKGAHLISPAFLSKSVFIFPRLGWIYNAGNKVKCRRFKRAGSWTLKGPLNRLGTSKCLLIYSFFFFSFSFLEFLNQMKEISSITVLEIYLCLPWYFNKKDHENNPMPKLYFFPFALLIWLFKCNLKTPDNQIEYTNSLCWIFWIALHFLIAGT